MRKLTALILALAMALSIAFPASAYFADWNGSREDVPTVPESFVELVTTSVAERMADEPDEPDESEELTFEEKVAINHDIEDERWFDLPECHHMESTVFPCWSPEDGNFYQEECDTCHLILNEWPREEDEEDEEEEECSHTSLVQYQSGSVFTVECADCGEILNEWTQELEEVDYSMDDSEELGACDDDEEVSDNEF